MRTIHIRDVSESEVFIDGSGESTITFTYGEDRRVVVHLGVWMLKYVVVGIKDAAKKFFEYHIKQLIE